MAFKPHRGTYLIDKNIQIDHDSYFAFYKETDKMKRSKIAYKWYTAAKYVNHLTNYFKSIEDFKNECLADSNRVYKPFLDLITQN